MFHCIYYTTVKHYNVFEIVIIPDQEEVIQGYL